MSKKSNLKIAELDADEVKNILRHMVKTNTMLHDSNKKPVTIELSGHAGLGKTSIGEQIASELGFEMVKINLAELDEIGDLCGYPVRQFEMVKSQIKTIGKDAQGKLVNQITTVQNPIPVWVDEVALSKYETEGYSFTGQHRTTNCPPEWVAGKTKPIFLILDDYTRADNRFMQATMSIVDRQEYVSWKLPKGSFVLLTTNPDDGEYAVSSLDDAQRTRSISIILKWDPKAWARWAEYAKLDTRAINFVLMYPEIVKEGVNPRSLTNFFSSISSLSNFEKEISLIQIIGEGSIGVEATSMFTQFIYNKMDKMITPEEILYNPDEDAVIKQLKSLITPQDGNYRNDIASIVATRLINYALMKAEEKKISDAEKKRLETLLTTTELFTMDVIQVITKRLFGGDRNLFKFLINNTKLQSVLLD